MSNKSLINLFYAHTGIHHHTIFFIFIFKLVSRHQDLTFPGWHHNVEYLVTAVYLYYPRCFRFVVYQSYVLAIWFIERFACYYAVFGRAVELNCHGLILMFCFAYCLQRYLFLYCHESLGIQVKYCQLKKEILMKEILVKLLQMGHHILIRLQLPNRQPKSQ